MTAVRLVRDCADGLTKVLRMQTVTPSGCVALHGFPLRKANCTSATVSMGTGTLKSLGNGCHFPGGL